MCFTRIAGSGKDEWVFFDSMAERTGTYVTISCMEVIATVFSYCFDPNIHARLKEMWTWKFLNRARVGRRHIATGYRSVHTWFLKIAIGSCVCVCMCLCLPPRALITSGVI